MTKIDKKTIEEFYTSDRFMEANLSHEVDSPWKTEQMKPFCDLLLQHELSPTITILDVGGGTGLILRDISNYIVKKHRRKIKQMSLDLSPGFLQLQMKNNPGLADVYNNSIESTPLSEKEVDLVLMIDVLEHLYNLEACYRELKRIAKYVLIKVPLEKNLTVSILDLLIDYKRMRSSEDGVGHLHFYNYHSIKRELEENLGTVMLFRYTDVFSYLLNSEQRLSTLSLSKVIYCNIARLFYKISPHFTSLIFNDFAMILVKCR